MKINELQNKNIAILWFWKEWKSTLEFLLKNWVMIENITILDNKNPDLENIHSVYWENYLDNLDEFDVIIKSPGISPYNPKVAPYLDKITSQIQIFFDNYSWKVINVTATKWKSTISTMIYEVLKEAWYRVKLLGNIWTPVLSEIDFNNKDNIDYIVYETSSYMLDWLQKNNYLSVLSNVYEDHLDRHDGTLNYQNAKLNILNWSQNIIILDDTYNKFGISRNYPNTKIFGKTWNYAFTDWDFYLNWEKVFDDSEMKLLGEHNRINTCAVLGVCDLIWINPEILAKVISRFTGLSHRIEFVWNYNWIDFYDDAISTTPESTIEAIKIFEKNLETIFLGWSDRWYHFENLVHKLKELKIKNIVLFPDSWVRIKELLWDNFNIFETSDMKEAVDFAFINTSSWKVCLLSCASPSYSIWKNFEEKWDLFKKFVREYGN